MTVYILHSYLYSIKIYNYSYLLVAHILLFFALFIKANIIGGNRIGIQIESRKNRLIWDI